jgi:L-aspartate oxidase
VDPESLAWAKQLATAAMASKERIAAIRQELPILMWQSAGICREQTSLNAAIEQIKLWQTEFNDLSLSQLLTQISPPKSYNLPPELSEQDLCTWGETRNLLEIGLLILTGAAMRTESRGGHYRTDFPAIDPDWQVHTLVQVDHWFKSHSDTGSALPI